jgi:hypothetical protein
MRFRHATDDEPDVRPRGSDDAADDRAALRADASALADAADDAISRVLSRDPTEFLARHRQAGGQ